ncbi:hypothetical protein FA15DRAFT_711603 [Coprinopsis marcescibilis]|uniref:GPI inositol-deacylase winged helix domain-containing protein n=1 Tax=Coprinopsis marcescibilis TaxID=230819 RepID=A0A5C3KA78_COPMA|nr:hypothetical protein FA15DRAFT_711603 [Coprinopsis marcescibilis]
MVLLDVLKDIFNSDLFDQKFCSLNGLDQALSDTQIDLPLLEECVPKAKFIPIVLHGSDVEWLINEKLSQIKMLRNLLEKEGWKETVLQVVVEKSSGMFLAAALQLNMLERCMHVRDLLMALVALPVGLSAMYATTMHRIKRQDGSELAKIALMWLVHAFSSLTMDNLQHAVAVNTTTLAFEPDVLVLPDALLSTCCGLITFELESNLVRLVHHTARNFLEPYLHNEGVDPHTLMASVCMAHLLTHGFNNLKGDLGDLYYTKYYGYTIEVFDINPFLRYSHRCWAAHTQSTIALPIAVKDFVQQCDRFTLGPNTTIGHWWDYINAFQLVALCNFSSLLAGWLDLDSPLSYYYYPPPANIDVNSTSALGRTLLALAAMKGHIDNVQLLLSMDGIDSMQPDIIGLMPLAGL